MNHQSNSLTLNIKKIEEIIMSAILDPKLKMRGSKPEVWTSEDVADRFASFVRPGYGIVIGISQYGNPYFGSCGTTKIHESYDGHRVLEVRARAVKSFAKKVYVMTRSESGYILIEEFYERLEIV
jgi:hypothetical protein